MVGKVKVTDAKGNIIILDWQDVHDYQLAHPDLIIVSIEDYHETPPTE